MRRMKLEPIIQNEVNQKEKHQYGILTHTHTHTHTYIFHIYMEFRKMVTMTLYVRQKKRDTYVKNRLVPSVGEAEGGMI